VKEAAIGVQWLDGKNPRMEPARRKRRRYVMATLAVAGLLVVWRLSPKADPRFVGTWTRSPTMPMNFLFGSDGYGYASDPSSSFRLTFRWRSKGDEIEFHYGERPGIDGWKDFFSRTYKRVWMGEKPFVWKSKWRIVARDKNSFSYRTATGNSETLVRASH
jgi:hypothetical protein